MAVAEVTAACRELSCRSKAPSIHEASQYPSHGSIARHATAEAATDDPSAASEAITAACDVEHESSREGPCYNATAATNKSATCCFRDYNSTQASDQSATTCYSNPCETTPAPVESCSSAFSSAEDSNEGVEEPRQQYKLDQTCDDLQLVPGESEPGHLELDVTSSSSNCGHLDPLACVADVECCSISEPTLSSSTCPQATVTLATDPLAVNDVSSDSSGYCSPEQHRSPFAASGGEDVTVQKAFRDTCPEQPSTDGGVTDGKLPPYANGFASTPASMPPSFCFPYYNSYAGEASVMSPDPYSDYQQSVAQSLYATGDPVGPAWSDPLSGGYYLSEEGYLRYWSPSPLFPSTVNLLQGASGMTLYSTDYRGLASEENVVYPQQQEEPTYYSGRQPNAPMDGSSSSYVAPFPIGNLPSNCQLTQCPVKNGAASFVQNLSINNGTYGSTAPMSPNGYCDNSQYLLRALQQQYDENQSSLSTGAPQQQSASFENNQLCNPSSLHTASKEFSPNFSYHQGNKTTNNGTAVEQKTFTPIKRRFSLPNHRVYHYNNTHPAPASISPSMNSTNSGPDPGRSSDVLVTRTNDGGPIHPLSSDVRLSLGSNKAGAACGAPDAVTIAGSVVALRHRSTSATTSRSPSASPQKRFSVDVAAAPSNPSTGPSPQHRQRSITQGGLLCGDGGPLNLSVPKRLMKQYNCYQRLDLPPNCLGKPQLLSTQTHSTRGVEATWRAHMELLFRNLREPWLISRAPDHFTCGGSWASYRDLAKVRFYCPTCSDGWTSMYGVVIFYYRRNITTTQYKSRWPPAYSNSTKDLSSRSKGCAGLRTLPQRPQQPSSVSLRGNGVSEGWGQVLYQVAGQKCGRCSPLSFEMPLWYAEEAQKVITNLYYEVARQLYGLCTPTPIRTRRLGQPHTHHNAGLCQGCQHGLCKVVDSVTGYNSTQPIPEATAALRSLASPSSALGNGSTYAGQPPNTQYPAATVGYQGNNHTGGYVCNGRLYQSGIVSAEGDRTPYCAGDRWQQVEQRGMAVSNMQQQKNSPDATGIRIETNSVSVGDVKRVVNSYVVGLRGNKNVRATHDREPSQGHQNMVYEQEGLLVSTPMQARVNRNGAMNIAMARSKFFEGVSSCGSAPFQDQLYRDAEWQARKQTHTMRRCSLDGTLRQGKSGLREERRRNSIQSYTPTNNTDHETAHDANSSMKPLEYEHLVRNSRYCGRNRGAMSNFSGDNVSKYQGSHVAKKIGDRDDCTLVEENSHHSGARPKADKARRYQFSGYDKENSFHQPSLPSSSTYHTIQNVYKPPNLPVYGGYTKYDSSFNSSGMYFYAGSMMNDESLYSLGTDSSSLCSPLSLYGSILGGSSLPASYFTPDSSSSPPWNSPSHSTPQSDYCFRNPNINYHPYNYPTPYPADYHLQSYAAYPPPLLSGSITETPPAQQGMTDHVIAGAPSTATAAL